MRLSRCRFLDVRQFPAGSAPRASRALARAQRCAGAHLVHGLPDARRRPAGRGWPRAGLVEILTPQPGVGELHLLIPTLARLTGLAPARWVAWIAPPFEPYAPRSRHTMSRSTGNWSCARACRSGPWSRRSARGVRGGARVGAGSAAARSAPPAAGDRARPYARFRLSQPRRGARGFARRAAALDRAAGRGRGSGLAQEPRRQP